MRWVCPICEQVLWTTIDKIREVVGAGPGLPGWWCERMGRRSLGVSHLMKDHRDHARRDELIKALQDDAAHDLDRILELQRNGLTLMGSPFD